MDKFNRQYAAYIHDQIIKIVSDLITKECAILDFGCGDGLLTYFMHNSFYKAQIFGIDSNENLIENARKEFTSIVFNLVLDTTLPFADATFDLIYAVDVFHHIQPKDHAPYVSELLRVLKSDGRIILFEVNPYNPFAYIRFKKNPLEEESTLLLPSYASQLFKKNNCIVTLNYYFLSRFFPSWLQEYIHYVPCGSVYSVLVYKN